MSMNYIYFHNASPFPLMVDTWINLTMESRLIQPNGIYLLERSTTEWHMNTMFFGDKKNREIWEKNGYGSLTQLGMFSSVPCIKGNHVWMEHDGPFDCIYSKIKDGKTDGLITFFIRRDNKKNHIKLE